MWDGSQPPSSGFRDHPDEPFSQRWSHGIPPGMRDRPFPFQGAAGISSSHFGSQGGLYSRRDMGTGQHAAWEEGRIPPEEPMNFNLSRRGHPPVDYRDLHLREEGMHYREQNTLGNEFRGLLAPDMDYRAKEASIVDHRERGRPDVDYRHEKEQAIAYRVKLPPPSIYRERESLEYRKQMVAEVGLRERAALDLERRERLAAALDYRDREVAELEYNRRLNILLERRKREAALLEMRERDAAEILLLDRGPSEILIREREAAALALREREAVALALREREAMELELRERMAMDYRERGIPGHFRESADHNLRGKESNMEGHIDRERGLDYRERGGLDYSGSENRALRYREKETAASDFMEVQYKEQETFDEGPQNSAEMGYRHSLHAQYKKMEVPGVNFQKHKDTDYRGKETTDSDYRDKEIGDSDYRDRENTLSDYRDMKFVDLDYRGKEKTDSDYRERESADSDYRKSADNPVVAESDDSRSVQKTNQEAPTEMKAATDYSEVPAPVLAPKESLFLFDDFKKPVLNADDGRNLFLSYEEPRMSALPTIKSEGPHQDGPQANATSKGEVQSKSKASSCPGKLDTDFRDRSKPENPKLGPKDMVEKTVGYTDNPSKDTCPSDQDLRKKEDFSKESKMVECDQDFRTSGYKQEKDEDLRVVKEQSPVALLNQNSMLFDFLKMAAKELKRQREQDNVIPETKGQSVSHTSETPSTDPMSHQAQNTASAKSSGPEGDTPGMKFIGSEDTDYRKMDFSDVDLRGDINFRLGQQAKHLDKRSREDPQPGSKDKDYRRATLPDGATRIIWLDGLPTGASREEILSALGGAHRLPESDVNLIGYIPGYSLGSVCVEFSLVEEAVGCMDANKGIVNFRGKQINLKYVPNSDRWNCQQCKTVNVLSKERCWQCSALRAGSDHLPLRDAPKVPMAPYSSPSQRGKKRKAKQNTSIRSPDKLKETSPRERSPPKSNRGTKEAESKLATVIIRGLGFDTYAQCVVKALRPYVQISASDVRVMRNRKTVLRGIAFVDLKSHKEAMRLIALVRDLKPPLTINGKPIIMDLAVRPRNNEQPKTPRGGKRAPGKSRKRRGQRKSLPGYKGNVNTDGPSYVYYPKTGMYVDPMTEAFSNSQPIKQPLRGPGKEPAPKRRRGFTEDEVTDSNEDLFKKPLPPQVAKKEEPVPEPKENPLIKLIGEYGDDSDEEEEQKELLLPPLRKKPPPPAPAPKPAPKPAAPMTSSSSDDKLTDWKKMACLLCRRQFSSKETLIRHQTLSSLHKQNLLLHEKIKKSHKELMLLQQKEIKENQSIQRRLQQAKKELEKLEREEEGTQQ